MCAIPMHFASDFLIVPNKDGWKTTIMRRASRSSVFSSSPAGLTFICSMLLDSCAHTQNEVLADQSNCDKRMCLQEFVAYGCLRSGEQGQWYNVLRELASSALSFNELAVVQLFKQAAWEFGSFCHETNSRFLTGHFKIPNSVRGSWKFRGTDWV